MGEGRAILRLHYPTVRPDRQQRIVLLGGARRHLPVPGVANPPGPIFARRYLPKTKPWLLRADAVRHERPEKYVSLGADPTVLKKIACQNAGIFYSVTAGTILDTMASYFQVLAPMLSPCKLRWTLYNDYYTGKELLGACLASFELELDKLQPLPTPTPLLAPNLAPAPAPTPTPTLTPNPNPTLP